MTFHNQRYFPLIVLVVNVISNIKQTTGKKLTTTMTISEKTRIGCIVHSVETQEHDRQIDVSIVTCQCLISFLQIRTVTGRWHL